MALVEQALARWGWASVPCAFVAGRENMVYKVNAPEGEFALRVKRQGYRSEAELLSELQWLSALDRAGVPVPRPQPSLDGRWLESVQDTFVDVLSWMDGQALGQTGQPLQLHDAPQTFWHFGAALARLHEACDQWQPPPSFTRCNWDADGLLGEQPLWGRFWDNPGLDASTRELLLAFRQRARACLAESPQLDYGLIHADGVRENVLVNDGHIQLIDFDDGGFGYRLFDVATALLKNRSEANFPYLQQALLAGYRSVREIDTRLLDLFMALRAVTYVGWIVPRLNEAGGAARQGRFLADARALCAAWMHSH